MWYKSKFDWPLFFIFLALGGAGLFSILGIGGAAGNFFEKQFLFLGIGAIVFF